MEITEPSGYSLGELDEEIDGFHGRVGQARVKRQLFFPIPLPHREMLPKQIAKELPSLEVHPAFVSTAPVKLAAWSTGSTTIGAGTPSRINVRAMLWRHSPTRRCRVRSCPMWKQPGYFSSSLWNSDFAVQSGSC